MLDALEAEGSHRGSPEQRLDEEEIQRYSVVFVGTAVQLGRVGRSLVAGGGVHPLLYYGEKYTPRRLCIKTALTTRYEVLELLSRTTPAFEAKKGLCSHGPVQGHHGRLEPLLAVHPRSSAFFKKHGERNQYIYTALYSL